MSYKISFRDKSEIIVPQDVGEKLQESMLGDSPPEHITLAGELYRTSQIMSVTKSNLATANSDRLALPQGPQYNCGPYSIQAAIHKIALRDRHNWSKLVQDEEWREKTRLAIRAKFPNKKWCDSTTGEHACLEVSNAKA